MGDEKNYLTVIEAAEYLGISVATLRRLYKRPDGLPSYTHGGAKLLRFTKDDLDRWANDHRRRKAG